MKINSKKQTMCLAENRSFELETENIPQMTPKMEIPKESEKEESKEDPNKFKRQDNKLSYSKKRFARLSNDYDRGSNTSTQVLLKSPKNEKLNESSPNISKLRRMFGSEKMVREHAQRTHKGEMNESMMSEAGEPSKYNSNFVEPNEHEKSIFERSTFKDYTFKKFQEIQESQLKELSVIKLEFEKEAKRKKDEIEKEFRENKLSMQSFDRKRNGIEKWIYKQKKEIKKKEKNFIQILGYLQKEQDDLQNFRKNIQSPDLLKPNPDQSSLTLNNSTDSIKPENPKTNISKSEYQKDKHITPLRDITAYSHLKPSEFLGNSNISMGNSIINSSRADKGKINGKEKELEGDKKRGKSVGDKEKHLYSIIPFEYKSKSGQPNVTSYEMAQQKSSNRSASFSKEIVVEKRGERGLEIKVDQDFVEDPIKFITSGRGQKLDDSKPDT